MNLKLKYKLNIYKTYSKQTSSDQYYWNIVSVGNNKIIVASSEGFSSRQNCKDNIYLLWNGIRNDEIDTSDY
jgi:uncharacterized protein YegP (UPF0339 family)